MPSFDFQCDEHGKFEAFKRIKGPSTAPCPYCGQDAEKVFSITTMTFNREYDQSIDGVFPNAGKAEVMNRGGGGKAVQVKETGAYRPVVTHSTKCPKENKWRNVAVTSAMAGAVLVTCEGCDYSWLHRSSDAADPLLEEVVEAYRPGITFNMNPDLPMRSGYQAPGRGN